MRKKIIVINICIDVFFQNFPIAGMSGNEN